MFASMNEAQLQHRLVQDVLAGAASEALFMQAEPLGTHSAQTGFEAYANNVRVSAASALGAAMPTVRLLLGAVWFDHCAVLYWQAQPPEHGLWSAWGQGFADWYALTNLGGSATEHPYIADVARLDWSMHCAELAADTPPAPETWALMASAAPETICLALYASVAVLKSAYPLVDFWRAHHAPDERQRAQAKANIQAALSETSKHVYYVQVWRQGWRAQCEGISQAAFEMNLACMNAYDLSHALELAMNVPNSKAGQAFEFQTWLASAVAKQRLLAVIPLQATSNKA